MSKKCPQICANCKNWKPFDVDYDHPEDFCGYCKVHDGEVTYGDDDRCEEYKQAKKILVTSFNY